MIFIKSDNSISGLSITFIIPSQTSPRLCGGIFVAIPTAIPVDPFIRRFGDFAGSTDGSSSDSSKLGTKLTVSFSISLNNSSASAVILASVYRIAAALSPSTDPKFPCPDTRRWFIEKGCAILTIVWYTAESP